jgi:hypothetical protein
MYDYPWALSKYKLHSSIQQLKDKRKMEDATNAPKKTELDEETIKDQYIKRGGLVKDMPVAREEREFDVPTGEVADGVTLTAVKVTRRGRPTKDAQISN